MKIRIKIIVASLFILLGFSLFCYGALFHSRVISIPDKEKKSIESAKSEPSLIKLASIGGIIRDASGKINQSFAEGQTPPKKCAT